MEPLANPFGVWLACTQASHYYLTGHPASLCGAARPTAETKPTRDTYQMRSGRVVTEQYGRFTPPYCAHCKSLNESRWRAECDQLPT